MTKRLRGVRVVVALVAIAALGDLATSPSEECSHFRLEDAHVAVVLSCGPEFGPPHALTPENILHGLESGAGNDLAARAAARSRRSAGERDPLGRGELALRRGSLAQAVDYLRIPQSDAWREFDRRLLLSTVELLQSDRDRVPLAALGRIDQLAGRLRTESKRSGNQPEPHGLRRVRLSRLLAGWDPQHASRLAYDGWHAAYRAANQRLAADALMVMATAGVASLRPRRSAMAARAEQVYLREGADAHALLARSITADGQAVNPPQSPAIVCAAAARDLQLLEAECLLAVATMNAAAGAYRRAVDAVDQLLERSEPLTPLVRGRHAVVAAPLYELVGRVVDAERVLLGALRSALPSPINDRAALQLAGLQRRAGRPVAAERALSQLTAAAGSQARRLIELALIRASSGSSPDVVADLLDHAEQIAIDAVDPALMTAVALGRHAGLGMPSAGEVATALRPLRESVAGAARHSAGDSPAWSASLPERISIAQAFAPLRRPVGDPRRGDSPAADRDRLMVHVRHHLDGGQRVLVFETREDAIDVTLLGVSDTRSVRLQIPPDRLQALVSVWSASIEQNLGAVRRELGRALSRSIVDPILRSGGLEGVDRLIVVPDLGVRGLPFDALPVGGSNVYFAERFAVSRAGSLVSLDAAWHRTAGRAPALVVLPQRGGAPELESSAALSALPGRALTGRRATETELRRLAPQAGLLHFGGHAAPVGGTWASGGLGLWADSVADGTLTFPEILSLDLDGPRVVLLGCETGRGRTTGVAPVASPETSLASAFLAGGARSTISTHWRITDAEARTLAREFYAAGGARGSVVSLAAVKRRLRHRFPDRPRLWAAAVWDGAPDAVVPESAVRAASQ